MTDTSINYTASDGTVARYRGGAYIDLGYADGEHFHALDTINVYDYAKGEPTIAFTPRDVANAVEQHLASEED